MFKRWRELCAKWRRFLSLEWELNQIVEVRGSDESSSDFYIGECTLIDALEQYCIIGVKSDQRIPF